MNKQIAARQAKVWGSLFRQARQDKNLTQEELSSLCGITSQHVSHFETGRRTPSMHNAIRLCLALQISLDVIFMHFVPAEYYPRPFFILHKRNE